MIKYDGILTPQNYLAAVTGKWYILKPQNVVEQIRTILMENDFSHLLGYPFQSIFDIPTDVVLVNVSGFDDDGEYYSELYWFGVPKNFEEVE